MTYAFDPKALGSGKSKTSHAKATAAASDYEGDALVR
jgi:hypothetical protein